MAAALAAFAIAVFGACFDGGYNGRAIDPPLAKPAVAWSRADGTPFDVRRETEGKVTLLFFGYTHCPDICPMHMMNIAAALRSLGADSAAMVRVLFVTIDPQRDTGAVVNTWLRAFDPRFVALRGPMESVNAEVARLGLTPPARPGSAATPDPDHASAVVAFSRDGEARLAYPETTNVNAWVYDIRKLLRDRVPR